MTGWLATILIFLPLAGAILVWVLPVGRFAGPIALLVALAEIGFWIDALGQMNFDKPGPVPNFDQQLELVQRPRRLVPRRLLRLLVLARRVGGRRHGGGDRVRLLGRTRPAERVLRPDAVPDVRDGRRLRVPGSPALLRLLRGDDDPALSADRGLGRPGTARRDGQVRHLHDGGLAADARLGDRLRAVGGLVRPRHDAGRATTRGSSSGSWSLSRSRRRSSRCTAGCRTPTGSRRRRWRRCSRA